MGGVATTENEIELENKSAASQKTFSFCIKESQEQKCKQTISDDPDSLNNAHGKYMPSESRYDCNEGASRKQGGKPGTFFLFFS